MHFGFSSSVAQHWMVEGERWGREQVTSDLEWLKKGDENDPARLF